MHHFLCVTLSLVSSTKSLHTMTTQTSRLYLLQNKVSYNLSASVIFCFAFYWGNTGLGFPGDAIGKEPACQFRRHKRCRFNPWVGKILSEISPEYWKDWCWNWSSSILVIWCEQMTHWKSPWCWERSRAERDEVIRGWDGWMASLMKWTWTFANSGRWWGTGRPSVPQSVGLQRVRHNWVTEQ